MYIHRPVLCAKHANFEARDAAFIIFLLEGLLMDIVGCDGARDIVRYFDIQINDCTRCRSTTNEYILTLHMFR